MTGLWILSKIVEAKQNSDSEGSLLIYTKRPPSFTMYDIQRRGAISYTRTILFRFGLSSDSV